MRRTGILKGGLYHPAEGVLRVGGRGGKQEKTKDKAAQGKVSV
jgi:hypothetical protein